MVLVLVNYNNPGGVWGWFVYIYAFSRRFYPKWLTVYSGYTFINQYVFPGISYQQTVMWMFLNIPHYLFPLWVTGCCLAVFFFPSRNHGSRGHQSSRQWEPQWTQTPGTESARSLENSLDISTSPPTPAWAACWRSACGTTKRYRSGRPMSITGSNISQDKPVCVSLSGLSPAWLLQYVLVKDLQTGSKYFLPGRGMALGGQRENGRQSRDRGGKPQVKPRLSEIAPGVIRS